MYKYITNPLTGRKVKIAGRIGRKVLTQYLNQTGAGICKLCGSKGTNASTCPLNPKSKKTAANARKHPLARVAPSPRPVPAPVR